MKKSNIFLLYVLVLLTACIPKESPFPEISITPKMAETTSSEDELPSADPEGSAATTTITVVYTNDEHGWMAGEEEGRGAAELTGLWNTEFPESDVILPISGGDNWTGPAISTWFQGESMIEVMNVMGYVASVVGNHEFDFDTTIMAIRSKQADFPYLGANIQYKSNGEIPTDIGIQPYTVIEIGRLKIGIIGLANQETPLVTDPRKVVELDFTDYEEALREYVPEVQAAGADLILVPSHICQAELNTLASNISDLNIALLGSGHCHEQFADLAQGTVLLGGGSNLRSYAFATFEVETSSATFELLDYGVEENIGGAPHPQVAEIIAYWQELTDQELNVTIGYLKNDIEQYSDEMAALITQSWLWAYPADVAITNWGGMRDRIPAGEITYASIISVMPFENVLMDVALSGTEVGKVLQSGDYLPAMGGLIWNGSQWISTESRNPLDPDTTYHLLVSDFMYAGGDNYRIADFDPEAYNTAINWRQPVIDWIIAQESSREKPLDEAIQGLME